MTDKRIVLEYHTPPLAGLRRIIGCLSNTILTPGATQWVADKPRYVKYREVVVIPTEDDCA